MAAKDTFVKCRARIGAARMLLEPLDGALRDANSGVQRIAVVDLLSNKGDAISPEQSLTLSNMTMACNFVDSDKTQILNALRDQSSTKTGRRKQQNGMAFLNYVTDVEWEAIPGKDLRGVASLFVDVCVNRMECINPIEPMIKLVASASFVALTNESELTIISIASKNAIKKHVRTQFDLLYRNFQKYWKNMTNPAEYCMAYPEDPNALEGAYPTLHKSIMRKLGGKVTASRLDSVSLALVESTWQCRGSGVIAGSNSTAMVPLEAQGCMSMQQQQQMFGCLMKFLGGMQPRQDSQEDLLQNLVLGGARKRSAGLLRQLASEDGDELELQTPRKKLKPMLESLLNRTRTFDDSSASRPLLNRTGTGLLEAPETSDQASTEPETRGQASTQNNEAAAVTAHAETPSEGGAQKSQAIPEAVESLGADAKLKAENLLDAMIQRDQERAAASAATAKEKKAQERGKKKEEKAKEQEQQKAEKAKEQETQKAAKANEQKQLKAEKMAEKAAAPTPCESSQVILPQKPVKSKMGATDTIATPKKIAASKKPTFSNEHSRNQFLCRTGASGPGQSFAFKYGIDKKTGMDHKKTEAQARAEAKAWLAKANK